MDKSTSEIFRMVVTLQQRGYLAVVENDRYSLTLKMMELSHHRQPLKPLMATASPPMRELAGRACQSCHPSVYHDGRILVVAQVDAPGPFTMAVKVGALGWQSVTWPCRRIRGATNVSQPIFGLAGEVIAALTVPYIERMDRPQSPSIPDVEAHVREISQRLSSRMSYTSYNTL